MTGAERCGVVLVVVECTGTDAGCDVAVVAYVGADAAAPGKTVGRVGMGTNEGDSGRNTASKFLSNPAKDQFVILHDAG